MSDKNQSTGRYACPPLATLISTGIFTWRFVDPTGEEDDDSGWVLSSNHDYVAFTVSHCPYCGAWIYDNDCRPPMDWQTEILAMIDEMQGPCRELGRE